jgi:hypothetical protein
VLRRPGLYRALLPLHLLVYIVDDLIYAGPLSYSVTLRATARAEEGP